MSLLTQAMLDDIRSRLCLAGCTTGRFSLVISRATSARIDNGWLRGFHRNIRRRTHGGKLT